MNPAPELELLLTRLDALRARATRGDAIDAVLAAAPRSTGVRSLREHETVARFRRELSEGRIATDTANQLLGLVRGILETVVMP